MQRFSTEITKSLAKGVSIHVITYPQKCSKLENNDLPVLEKSGVVVHKVSINLHAKLLFCDEHAVACGSFNWLSASLSAQHAQVE